MSLKKNCQNILVFNFFCFFIFKKMRQKFIQLNKRSDTSKMYSRLLKYSANDMINRRLSCDSNAIRIISTE